MTRTPATPAEERRRSVRRRRAVAVLVFVAAAVAAAAVVRGEAIGDVGSAGSSHAPPARTRHSAGRSAPASFRPSPGPPAASRTRNVYAATGPGMFSAAVRSDPERMYVPNSDAGTVTVINPHTFRVLTTFATGSSDEHVTPSWNLKSLYVDNTASNSLTVLNPQTARPVRTFHVLDPYNLYFTPDGTKAIVVAEGYQRLDFHDAHTWKLLRQVPIPSPGPDISTSRRTGSRCSSAASTAASCIASARPGCGSRATSSSAACRSM